MFLYLWTIAKSLTLLYGTNMPPGRQMVASAQQMVGLVYDKRLTN